MRKTLNEGLRFYIVGGTGIFVNLGVLYLLVELFQIWYFYSAIFGIIASITTNFFGNKIWTFKDRKTELRYMIVQYIKFWIVSLLGISIQLSLLYFFVEYFNIWYISSSLIAIIIASFSNFLLNKFWTFR
jgi:dolichol-phosphate mannosyltransferase